MSLHEPLTRRDLLALIGRGSAGLVLLGRSAPAVAEPPPARLLVKADGRFRAAAACLLLTSYAEYQSELRPHPIRVATDRAVRTQRAHPCAQLFGELVASGWFGGRFYSLAAWLASEPPFGWIAPFRAVVLPALRLEESPLGDRLAALPALLTSFVEAANLQHLWKADRAEWERVLGQVRALLDARDVGPWLVSFWGPPPKQLVVVPNPTDPATFGFYPQNRDQAFAVIGPPAVRPSAPEGNVGDLFDYSKTTWAAPLVVHEFSHVYLSDLVGEIQTLAGETTQVGEALNLKDWYPRMYRDWWKQLEEAVVRAAEAVWRAEVVSEAAADEFVEGEIDRFGIDILRPLYREVRRAREGGRRVGAEGCVTAARRALAGG
jgi:hypothetical protein